MEEKAEREAKEERGHTLESGHLMNHQRASKEDDVTREVGETDAILREDQISSDKTPHHRHCRRPAFHLVADVPVRLHLQVVQEGETLVKEARIVLREKGLRRTTERGQLR
jgi:hypothetical protein